MILVLLWNTLSAFFFVQNTVSVRSGNQATNAFDVVNTNQDAAVTFADIIKALKKVLPGMKSMGMLTMVTNTSDTNISQVHVQRFKMLK